MLAEGHWIEQTVAATPAHCAPCLKPNRKYNTNRKGYVPGESLFNLTPRITLKSNVNFQDECSSLIGVICVIIPFQGPERGASFLEPKDLPGSSNVSGEGKGLECPVELLFPVDYLNFVYKTNREKLKGDYAIRFNISTACGVLHRIHKVGRGKVQGMSRQTFNRKSLISYFWWGNPLRYQLWFSIIHFCSFCLSIQCTNSISTCLYCDRKLYF